MSRRLSDIATALSLLTRLPIPDHVVHPARNAQAAWAYPIVGVIIGGLGASVALLAVLFGLPAPLVALLAVAAQIMASGAMHEDGLADMVDGFWGGWSPAQRLAIMSDSHIGSYGVLALILSIAARWAALWLLIEVSIGVGASALIAAAILSRAPLPALMCAMPHAKDSGLSRTVGQVTAQTALLAAGIAGVLGLFLLGWSVVPAIFWLIVITIGVATLARIKIGGQTGDVLGATQQLAEIALLFSILM